MIAWIRKLVVKLSSSSVNKSISFGDDYGLKIKVTGHKYLSSLKDEFVVKIYNLDYFWLTKLIKDGYDEIEIFTGYKSFKTPPKRLFKGGILNISNDRTEIETSCVILVCTSLAIAKQANSYVNLTLNSGLNMYSALEFISRIAGFNNVNIDNSFKNLYVQDSLVTQGTGANALNDFANSTDYINVSSDSSEGSIISIFNLTSSSQRVIDVTSSQGMIINGRINLTSEGITFDSLPVFNFMPGDVVRIDNALLTWAFDNRTDAMKGQSIVNQIDSSGLYIVWNIDYSLNNAGGDFKLTLHCKSKSLYSKGGLLNGKQSNVSN